jgi:glutamate racemase
MEFHVVDGPELPVPDRSVDAVISLLSFRYLDWDPVMSEIRRVLRPGGRLLVVDMVTAPLTIKEVPRFLLAAGRTLIQQQGDRRFRAALKTLVSDPRWQIMVSYNPIRAQHELVWELDLVCVSDAGYTPYGKVPPRELAGRVSRVIGEMNVDAVVLACNAASAVLGDIDVSVPLEGVIRHGVSAALASPHQHLGVVGGHRTIEDQVYGRPLRDAGRVVIERVAQPLSAHVEAGRLRGEEVEAELEATVAPLAGVDALILACTHYAALTPLFKRALPGVLLMDPVVSLVPYIVEDWGLENERGSGALTVWTTGDPAQMQTSAKRAFGIHLNVIERRLVQGRSGG